MIMSYIDKQAQREENPHIGVAGHMQNVDALSLSGITLFMAECWWWALTGKNVERDSYQGLKYEKRWQQ